VIDLHPARVLRASFLLRDLQIVGFCDLAVGIGGHGELARTELGIGREIVESRDAVMRYAQYRGSGRVEFLLIDREGVGFDIATAGIRRRIEIDDDRALLQRFGK
jgi:hypothetical protein